MVNQEKYNLTQHNQNYCCVGRHPNICLCKNSFLNLFNVVGEIFFLKSAIKLGDI